MRRCEAAKSHRARPLKLNMQKDLDESVALRLGKYIQCARYRCDWRRLWEFGYGADLTHGLEPAIGFAQPGQLRSLALHGRGHECDGRADDRAGECVCEPADFSELAPRQPFPESPPVCWQVE
jgi:hypothetical protein